MGQLERRCAGHRGHEFLFLHMMVADRETTVRPEYTVQVGQDGRWFFEIMQHIVEQNEVETLCLKSG